VHQVQDSQHRLLEEIQDLAVPRLEVMAAKKPLPLALMDMETVVTAQTVLSIQTALLAPQIPEVVAVEQVTGFQVVQVAPAL
jgi:hypothetical protein